jgi:hypothetical protein
MGENGNPTRKDGGAASPSTVVQLVITFDQMTGALNVNGPIQNALLCYGMLETAKDVIRQLVKDNQSSIVRPSGISLVGN